MSAQNMSVLLERESAAVAIFGTGSPTFWQWQIQVLHTYYFDEDSAALCAFLDVFIFFHGLVFFDASQAGRHVARLAW